jgi:hypothetical protein
MGAKLKRTWPNSGSVILVLGRSHELYIKLASLAQKTFSYPERNEEKRRKFLEQISQLKDKNLVYMALLSMV